MEGTSYDWPHLRALASTPANITGDCEVVGNVFDIHGCECAEDARAAESMKVVLAIIVHVVGSVGINTGQNLQAMGLQRLHAAQAQRRAWAPCRCCYPRRGSASPWSRAAQSHAR